MPTTTQKGNYHRRRTRNWLELEGFEVETCEVAYRVWDKRTGAVIYRKRDLWGADLIASKENELHAIQVKANKGDIAKGYRELAKAPWPTTVRRWVVYWPARRRLTVGPEIEEVRT